MLLTMQTYYDLLRVRSNAPATDIVAAYHAARGMVSQSLRGTPEIRSEEAEALLKKLEEAYSTLSDPKLRNDYDLLLRLTLSPVEAPLKQELPHLPKPFTGAHLRQYREVIGLTLEQVFLATRIPLRYLQALEAEAREELPSRVYVQGFLKNLAQLYRLPPSEVSSLFLEHLETLH